MLPFLNTFGSTLAAATIQQCNVQQLVQLVQLLLMSRLLDMFGAEQQQQQLPVNRALFVT